MNMHETNRPTKEQILANHLTQEQLMTYHSMPHNNEETHEIGRHLLICKDCLKKLPLPTREQFLKAVFGDGTDEVDFD